MKLDLTGRGAVGGRKSTMREDDRKGRRER